jgi:hypothetical protein
MKYLLLISALAACGGGDDPCDPDAPNTICTIAGSGEQGFNKREEGGPATKAALYVPQDTAMSPDGELWILDFNNYLVRRIDGEGNIHRMVGTGELGDSPADEGVPRVPALDAGFNHTSDLFFSGGYLYMAAWHQSRIKRVALDDMMLEDYAGRGRRTFYDGDEGPALMASLDLPSSIALDPDGAIVIMDQANQVIRKIDQQGNIHRIAGKCVLEVNAPCGATEVPQLCPASNKYVCGATPDTIDALCTNACSQGYSGDGGPALEARMSQPFGQAADPAGRLVYDRQGNLLFADSENNRVRKVDRNGIITTLAGNGIGGYSGDGGPANQASIHRPIDIEVADDNTVYFTDVDNNCIRKVDPAGIISTVVGVCDELKRGFAGDGGPPLEAQLDRPYGIELVGNKLYVADSYNNRIRVVNLP